MAAQEPPGTDRRLWLAAAVIAVAAFVLGCIGSRGALDAPFRWTDPVYDTLALFVLSFNMDPSTSLNIPLDIARFLAPAATGLAGFTAFYTLFRDEMREMRVRRWSGHVVVCGLGYKGFTFVQHLLAEEKDYEDPYRVVVVERDAANPTVDDCRALGVPVIIGDAQFDAILRKAGVKRAQWLIAVCNDDAVNTEILLSARTVVGDRRHGTLHCLAEISDSQLCTLLRVSQAEEQDGTWTAGFFNTDDAAAALILRDHPIADRGEGPPHHILVAHLDPVGRQLIVLAAQQSVSISRRHAHTREFPLEVTVVGDEAAEVRTLERAYPIRQLIVRGAQKWLSRSKRHAHTREVPLVVTVVDDEAAEEVRNLERAYPMLRDSCRFITTSTSREGIEQLEAKYAEGGWPRPSCAYVTASDDDEGVATTLRLMHHLKPPTKVVAALSRTYGTGNLLESLPDVGVQVFPRFEMTCTPDLLVAVAAEELAREIHEIWREEQRAANKKDPTWERASKLNRESSIKQALDIPAKLSSIGCSIRPLPDGDEPEFEFTEAEVEWLADKEHDRWISESLISGWTFAEGEKNEEAKTSPYLVPFGALPPRIAEWDRVFVRNIPRILQQAGLQVNRKKQGDAGRRAQAPSRAV